MTRAEQIVRGVSSLAVLAVLTGCTPPNAHLAPQTAREAVRQINADWADIADPIYAKAWLARFELYDGDGRHHRFIGAARVFYQPPRCLWFNIEHSMGGTAANIGSNDERYWVRMEIEDRRLWWGTWVALEAGASTPLIVPPGQLLDALMLSPLPAALPDGLPPLLQSDGWRRELLYQRTDADGWPYVARRIVLTPAEKYRPRRIIDYDAAGEVLMEADLWAYAPLGEAGDGPLTPRRYAVRWRDGTEMHLEIERVAQRGGIDPPCDFPSNWTGVSECLDQLPPIRLPGNDWETMPTTAPANTETP